MFFFFKQKTAYEMRISDWSSDVCSSDLRREHRRPSRFSPVQLGFPSSCGAFRASDQVSLLQFLPKLRRVLQQRGFHALSGSSHRDRFFSRFHASFLHISPAPWGNRSETSPFSFFFGNLVFKFLNWKKGV